MMIFLRKLKEKGLIGIFKSISCRFYNTFMSMHGVVAKCFWYSFRFLPINRHLILFESEPDFCDNAWALYNYLKRNRHQYRFVWIVKEPCVFKIKEDENTSFVTRYGKGMHLKTIYYYATACYNFYTHWTFQPYIPRKGQTVVNLFHGIALKGPKNSGFDYFDWFLTNGKFTIKSQSEFVGCSPEKVLPLGSPRNDILVHNISNGIENPFCPPNKNIKKVILWMPTYRGSINRELSECTMDTETGLPLIGTLRDIEALNEELEKLDVVIITKIHHLQAEKDIFKKHYSHFIFVTDSQLAEEGLQLYQIVGKSDALISDYSSIMVDYLIVNKPMGFILDDYNSYAESRGFSFSHLKENILKGSHIYTKSDFIQFVIDVVNENDPFKEERVILKKKFHDMPDGTNTKNIVAYFRL